MFYFRIKEFCSILCIFGKNWLYIVLHDFNLTYYSSIILGSLSILLFPKLCWHIGLTPSYVLTKPSQMASIGVIFTSTYHTKQLNPWPNSSASRVVNYSQLSACQGDMQPFEDDPYTRGCLTSLRNKPQQKQPGQLSASIPG